MSTFSNGAAEAGAAAGRALFAKLGRDWSAVVAELDVMVERRATLRGVNNPATIEKAQRAALDALAVEFDRAFDTWRDGGQADA